MSTNRNLGSYLQWMPVGQIQGTHLAAALHRLQDLVKIRNRSHYNIIIKCSTLRKVGGGQQETLRKQMFDEPPQKALPFHLMADLRQQAHTLVEGQAYPDHPQHSLQPLTAQWGGLYHLVQRMREHLRPREHRQTHDPCPS